MRKVLQTARDGDPKAPAGPVAETGRVRQKSRTRRHITDVARRLGAQGKLQSLADLADEAEVSRATVYRYFSSLADLDAEMALAVQVKEPDELFRGEEAGALPRVLKVHAHLFGLMSQHEAGFRAYLKRSMEQWDRSGRKPGTLREGRRARLLDAALVDLKRQLNRNDYQKLVQVLSLLVFIEPYILLKDIYGMTDAQADRTMRWGIERLLSGTLHMARGDRHGKRD
ncbi:MAG TPA: TetR/AcrR family transcriptional regulator [Candidatus Eisenbacteria bacterium]